MPSIFSFNRLLLTTTTTIAVFSVATGDTNFTVRLNPDPWKNWHKTPGTGGPFEALFVPTNGIPREHDHEIQNQEFVSGLRAIRAIVGKANQDGKRLRAFGSKWSMSNIAYDNEYLMDTDGLNYYRIGLEDSHVTPAYSDIKNRLTFVQSGVVIKSLNHVLLMNGLALSTSGSCDGQHLVGAIATGTHGSAVSFGSTQDYVRGIHLVLPGGHYFIQKSSSDSVVTQDFATSLDGAQLINDDDLFYAALVSFGSFGIVHGMLIEVEPLYRLRKKVRQLDYDDVTYLMTTLDPAAIGIDGVDEITYHFEIQTNPYHLEPGTMGAYIITMEKETMTQDEIDEFVLTFDDTYVSQAATNNDVFASLLNSFDRSILGLIPRWMGRLIPTLRTILIGLFIKMGLDNYTELYAREEIVRFPSEQWSCDEVTTSTIYTTLRSSSSEIGVPLQYIGDAMSIVLEVMNEARIPGCTGVRYVKGSNATLAFTKYEITAMIDIPVVFWDGLLTNPREQGYMVMRERLAASGIPHTYHWGKEAPLNSDWVKNAYGQDVLDGWKEQRSILLDEETRRMFSSDLLVTLGLHDD